LQVAAEGFDRTPVIKAKLGVREQVIPELVRHRNGTGPRSASRSSASTKTTGTAFAVPPDGNSRGMYSSSPPKPRKFGFELKPCLLSAAERPEPVHRDLKRFSVWMQPILPPPHRHPGG
jgi:hypothetical protein